MCIKVARGASVDNAPMQNCLAEALGKGMKKLRVKMIGGLLLVLAGSLGLAGTVGAQTVYKTVDEKGNVSYTDRPALQQEGDAMSVDVVDLQIKLTDPTVIAANREAANKDASANNVAADIRAEHAATEAEQQARNKANRSATCARAKSRLQRYRENRRIYREGENGDREYLDDKALDAERASAARSVEEWCD
jgi:hypothetical protein